MSVDNIPVQPMIIFPTCPTLRQHRILPKPPFLIISLVRKGLCQSSAGVPKGLTALRPIGPRHAYNDKLLHPNASSRATVLGCMHSAESVLTESFFTGRCSEVESLSGTILRAEQMATRLWPRIVHRLIIGPLPVGMSTASILNPGA